MTTTKTRPPLGERLIASMKEAVNYLENGGDLRATYVPVPSNPPAFDPARFIEFRESLKMTQHGMATFLNVSPKTVESWEQGTRKPGGGVLRLLQIIQNPEVLDILLGRKSDKPATRSARVARPAAKRVKVK